MQRLSWDIPSPRALPLLLAPLSQEPLRCVLCPGFPGPQEGQLPPGRVQWRLHLVRLGGGLKPALPGQAELFPVLLGERRNQGGKTEPPPQKQDSSPTPPRPGGTPSVRALAAPSPLYTSASLLKTCGNHSCALCPPGAWEAAGEGFLASGEALDGLWGDNIVLTLPPGTASGCGQLPHPLALSLCEPPSHRPHGGRPWPALASCLSPRASLAGVGPTGPSLLSPSIYSRVPARAWRRAVA